MPDNEETGLETTETSEEITHANGDTNRIAALERNQQVLQLLADPDINKIVAARRAGKAVKVVEDAEVSAPETTEPEEPTLTKGLEADDPTRGTLEKIEGLIKTRTSAKDAELAELRERVEQLSGVAAEVQRRDVNDQISKVQSKFKDFGKYKASMVELSGKHPGLGVEDLYVIAKSRAGELKQVEQATFSERPTAQPSRSATTARKGTPQPSLARGRKAFDNLVQDALKGIDVETLGG